MNKLARVLFVFILVVIALLLLGLMVTRTSAQEEPAPAVYLPMVGNKTSKGPFRVTGVLYKYGDVTYDCQIIRLAELWYYDPLTGEGTFVLCDECNPGDITGDPEKEEEGGAFVLDEVLDENGQPWDIQTTDHIFIVGKPECADCYDVVEWPLVLNLYAGQTQHYERVYAHEVARQYCWADPDAAPGGRKAYSFVTVDGEFVVTGTIDISEVDHAAE